MDDLERRRTGKALCVLSVVVIVIAVGLFTRDTVQSAATERTTVATYTRGILHLTIPYRAADAGAGQLTIEVLDPEDNILGRTQERLDVPTGSGRWSGEVKLEKPLAIEDLVWERVHYKFDYDNQRKAELDAREKALDEREKALAERERATASRRVKPADVQPQGTIRDPAQVKAERDKRIQQLPPELQLQGLIADPSRDNADKDSRMQERLAQRQRRMEELQKARMSRAVKSFAAEAASPTPSPAVEATSPSPSPTPE